MRSAVIRFISFFAALFIVVPASAQTSSSASGKSFMGTNQYLRTSEYLVADSRAFHALMQPDGNLCVHKGSGPSETLGAIWCSNVAPGKGSYFAFMQSDGNLCVYKGSPENNQGLVWCTHSAAAPPTFVVIQGDGNLVEYRGTGPGDNRGLVWNTGRTAAVSWLPGGRQVCETAWNLCWGISDLKQVSLLAPSPSTTAQKFVFMTDGTIRPALDSATCVSVSWMPAVHNIQQIIASLRLTPCDGSPQQKALHYSNGLIRHNQSPEGCLTISDVRTGMTGSTISRLLVINQDCSKPGGTWDLR